MLAYATVELKFQVQVQTYFNITFSFIVSSFILAMRDYIFFFLLFFFFLGVNKSSSAIFDLLKQQKNPLFPQVTFESINIV